ncbi:MAG TPA: 7TM domain-containing protein [Candidatus Peribacterales bacterium]|nr:7TM domain-containing protein [Candidatus Peribacterales bacterium]
MSLRILLLALCFPLFVHAQETVGPPASAPAPLKPVITGPLEVEVGKTLVLDASLSVADSRTVRYFWSLDSRLISTTEEAVLTLDKPGKYTLSLRVRDTVDGTVREEEITESVVVYVRKILLIAGPMVEEAKIELHRQSGEEEGVFVDVLHAKDLTIPLGVEDALTKLIAENAQKLRGAETIVLWADGAIAMNALSRALRQQDELLSLLRSQTIILITDRGLQRLARIIRGPFSVLEPEEIIITRKEAINHLIASENMEEFLSTLEKADIDSYAVDKATFAIRPWNILGTLVNYMVTRGVSSEMILLLLMLPVILMIVTFLKQVVGVTTFGLYAPAVITLSLIALGWKIGLVLLIIILIAGYVMRALIAPYRLLYIPKIAIILTVTSIVLLLVLAAAAAFGITLAPDTIFILLIMTTLSEEFMSVKAEMGLTSAIFAAGETVIVSLICFVLVQWDLLESMIIAYPELILLTLLANVMMGKWTGLRLSEVVRFREIFKYLEE